METKADTTLFSGPLLHVSQPHTDSAERQEVLILDGLRPLEFEVFYAALHTSDPPPLPSPLWKYVNHLPHGASDAAPGLVEL